MSFRGRVMHIMLRYRHLMKGQWHSEVIDQSTSIEAVRRECDQSAERLCKPLSGVAYAESDFPGCYSEWVIPDNVPDHQVVLYFHGGGFVMGNAKSHRNIVAGFMKRLGMKALVFDYSLAPEHPAPAAVNDSTEIYVWLLKKGFRPEDIVFAGDSAGGSVALGTLLKCKDEGIPMPAVCAAFSPSTDLTMSGASHRTRMKSDPCTPKGASETYYSYYIGSGDPKHPYASPLFGELSGLPPIILQVGNDETLRDDSTRFAEKAGRAGVEVKCHVWKGMFHCFPLLAPMFPEATAALEEVCTFIRQRMNPIPLIESHR